MPNDGALGSFSGGGASGGAPPIDPTPTPSPTEGAGTGTGTESLGGAPSPTPSPAPSALPTPSPSPVPAPLPGPNSNYDSFFDKHNGFEIAQMRADLGGQYLASDDQFKAQSFLDKLWETSNSRYLEVAGQVIQDHPEIIESQIMERLGTDNDFAQKVAAKLGWNEADYKGYTDYLKGVKPAGAPATVDPRDQRISQLEKQAQDRIAQETFQRHESQFGSFINDVNSPIDEAMRGMSFPMDQMGKLTPQGQFAQKTVSALSSHLLSENENAQKLYASAQAAFAKGDYGLGAMNKLALKAAVKDAATQASKQIGQWLADSAELAQIKAKQNGTTTEPGVITSSGAPRAQPPTPGAPQPTFYGVPGYGQFSPEAMKAEAAARRNSQR